MTRKKIPTQPKPSRAVGYVRISVDREKETSTETQEERIRAYCVAHGWELVDVIVEPGRSAYRTSRSSRPNFARAMGLISSGAADVLVVWKLDRAARNTVDTLKLVHDLNGHGAQLVSVTEHFDTSTASGRMTLTVLAALAEMESATKSERTQEWQEHRINAGMPPTGPRPFGYQRGGKDNPNVLTVDKAEAAMIRKAAKAVLAGKSLRSILRDFASAGVVSTKSGRPMTARTLQGILLGPTIAACRETSDGAFVSSTEWKPILDRPTWDAVRKVLMDPARRSSPGNGRRHLLAGIVRCARCKDEDGNALKLRSMPHVAGFRYACTKCHLSIDAERTNEFVVTGLLNLLDRKTWRRLRQGRLVDSAETDGSFEEAMSELTARFVAEEIDEVELARLAGALRQQRVSALAPPPTLPDVEDLRAAWSTTLKDDLEARRVVLLTMTESLTIKPWTNTKGFDEKRVEWVPAL